MQFFDRRVLPSARNALQSCGSNVFSIWVVAVVLIVFLTPGPSVVFRLRHVQIQSIDIMTSTVYDLKLVRATFV